MEGKLSSEKHLKKFFQKWRVCLALDLLTEHLQINADVPTQRQVIVKFKVIGKKEKFCKISEQKTDFKGSRN